jgi:hypothetical protein
MAKVPPMTIVADKTERTLPIRLGGNVARDGGKNQSCHT